MVDLRLRSLPSRQLNTFPDDDAQQIDPVARGVRRRPMKITEELVQRSKLKYGGLSEFSRQRCFIGKKDEG